MHAHSAAAYRRLILSDSMKTNTNDRYSNVKPGEYISLRYADREDAIEGKILSVEPPFVKVEGYTALHDMSTAREILLFGEEAWQDYCNPDSDMYTQV